MADAFDPYYVWLGIPPAEQPANHYRLLAINLFESNAEVIENAADQRMVHLRTFQIGRQADLSQRLLNEVATAKVCLLRPEKKAAYDQQLQRQLQAKAAAAAEQQPEIDSQLALALEREAQRGRSHARQAPQPGRGAILGITGAIAALAVVVAVWATATRNAPLQTAAVKTATEALKTGTEPQIPRPESQLSNSKSSVPDSSPLPQAGEGAGVRAIPLLAKPTMSAAEAAQIQKQWAEYLGRPVKATNSLGMPLLLIPPGEFDMGSTSEEQAWALAEGKKNKEGQWHDERVRTESPRHRVKISKPFYLGMYVVTQGEYEKVMGVNPSAFNAKPMDSSAFHPPLSAEERDLRGSAGKKVAGKDTSRYPVETVIWEEAIQFCRRLSAMSAERAAKRVYRLPNEAEWEYACRAGTTTRWYCGDDESGLVDVAWFQKNAGGVTHPVGQKHANAWGLYDMHGNLWQWCADRFSPDYYAQSPLTDPTGPPTGNGRVLRGGTRGDRPALCRSAFRSYAGPADRGFDVGFRVVADVTRDEGSGVRPPSAAARPQPAAETAVSRSRKRRIAAPPAQPSMSTHEAQQVQRQWGDYLGLPVEEPNSLGMPLVLIPPGTFQMGSPPDEIAWALEHGEKSQENQDRVASEAPRHPLKITRPFYLAKYLVTQAEFEKVMGVNPSAFTTKPMDSSAFPRPLPESEVKIRHEDTNKVAGKDTSRHPVETVMWPEAMEFCRRLSALPAERAARRVYRLPTEAEWEYACRAGTMTRWYSGDDPAGLADVAWFNDNSGGITHPVGEKKPNAWGLCDMYGNVRQWCADRFGADYYKQSVPSDPAGPPTGHLYVLRGGFCRNDPSAFRSASRFCSTPRARGHAFGFRVVAER
jgi:formylglycine-generating enzyme required for sulfatase activity